MSFGCYSFLMCHTSFTNETSFDELIFGAWCYNPSKGYGLE